MGYRGLNMVRVALIDEITEKIVKGIAGLSDTGIYEIDNKAWGSKTANITGMNPNELEVWGNNQLQTTLTSNIVKPQVALEVNNLPVEIQQALLNRIPDGNGGFKKDPDHKYHVALQVELMAANGRDKAYFCFPNGVVEDGQGVNAATETQTPALLGDQLTFKAQSAQSLDGDTYRLFSSAAESFDEAKMNELTFGGSNEAAPKE